MDYISLQEATRFCNYSQDYLKLRARQGKLKAIKIGRNWVTTKDWLREYSERVEKYWSKPNSTLNVLSIKLLLILIFIFFVAIFFFYYSPFLEQTINVLGDYFDWLGSWVSLEKIIPARVIEIK